MSARLDPDAQALVEVVDAMGLQPIYTLPVQEGRERLRAAYVTKDGTPSLRRVWDEFIPTPHGPLRCRLYNPADGRAPLALFFHGGGWTLNDIDTHDQLCRRIAKQSGWLIASLEYRLAPEHKYPAALEDAYLAYRWLLDNGQRLEGEGKSPALIGESSGATITAGLTLLLRDMGAPLPEYQILAYPVTDRHGRWPSYEERGIGYALDSDSMQWYFDNYLQAEWDPEDPYLFPLRAKNLSGLPQAMVMTAEFDPLRDEGIAYAQKLASAGVSVEHVHAADQMHGFLMMDKAVRRVSGLIDHLARGLIAVGRRHEDGF